MSKKKPWNKGKTKETNLKVRESGRKISKAKRRDPISKIFKRGEN